MIVDAVAYFGDMDDGVSRPKKMLCSDGVLRVVKFNHPAIWNRALLHEFIGHRLAKMIGVPVLDQTLVNVPEEMAILYQNIEGMSSGIKIGSPFSILDNNRTENGLFRVPYPTLYSQCKNVGDIPSILAYDIWTHNNDRGSNRGNLLIVQEKDGSKRMIVHDYGFAFYEPSATMDRYKVLTEFRGAGLDWQKHKFPLGPIYEALKMNIDLSDTSKNPFLNVVSNIESVSLVQLEDIFNEVPNEWQIPEYEKNAMISFLYDRRYAVRSCIDYLVSIWFFSIWDGGVLSWQGLRASSE